MAKLQIALWKLYGHASMKLAVSSNVEEARRVSIQEPTMDLDRDNTMSTTPANEAFGTNNGMSTAGMNNLSDRDDRIYDREGGGSNFLAFLIGGLVIAVGLLAFLFYDGGNSRDVSTTGSTTPRIERPASPSTMAPAAPTRPAPAQ
jgi:hypothetical protein